MTVNLWNMITDAELDVMKALWKTGPSKSSVIFNAMDESKSRTVGTKKTLLKRLVIKGAITRKAIDLRNYIYSPAISEEEYISAQQQWMKNRIFNGDVKKMLANFILEENISRKDMESFLSE